jgi:two-component system response regulator HydG
MTAFGTIESAVEAMRLGRLRLHPEALQRAGAAREGAARGGEAAARAQVACSPQEFRDKYHFENIVGRSPPIREVLGRIVKIAPTDATVLITGESGTGKELVAKAVHANSKRSRAALRPGELRGGDRDAARERALRAREGRLHRREQQPQGAHRGGHGGTFFFDEIAETSRPSRPSCCGCCRRARSARRRQQGHQGRHPRDRRDQPGPAPRHRREALPAGPLLPPQRRALRAPAAARAPGGHPPARRSTSWRRSAARCTPRAHRRRRDGLPPRYEYPGNIRELENMIEQAVALASQSGVVQLEDIAPQDLPTARSRPAGDRSLAASVDAAERAGDRGGAAGVRRQPRARGRSARAVADHAVAEDEAPGHPLAELSQRIRSGVARYSRGVKL